MSNLWIKLLCSYALLIFAWQPAIANPADSLQPWVSQGRIAGASVYVDMTPAEIEQVLSDMVNQKVTVIEADSDLSNYLSNTQFESQLELARTFTQAAHRRGLRVVWYYPTLEVLTPNGKNSQHSMYKDHPDWIQIGLDGRPNVLYGGGGRIHWVEKDMESAWMSLDSPYKDYFMERIKKLVATGVDGLWLDVPLLNDMAGVEWMDMNPYATAKFTADTGLQPPQALDWTNPVWRRWISWRPQEVTDFLEQVTETAQNISPEFNIIVETVTMDYAPTTIGLDGSNMKFSDGLIQVWEVDALSDANAMRNARHDDWMSLIAMNKFAKGASGDKPSWIFTYGLQPDDAELVMAEALASGNHPYETQIPLMATTVGAAYRQKMFSWIKAHSSRLFASQSAAPVAVLFSPPSRDYMDKSGLSLYATTESNDPLWWASIPDESVYQRTYLAEYRGMVKWLVNQHIPFDVIVNADANELAGYQTVLAPALTAVSDSDAGLLKQYIFNGGNLIITGSNPTGQNEYGTERESYALAEVLDYDKDDGLPQQVANVYGNGKVRYYAALLGKSYLVNNDVSANNTLHDAIAQTTVLPLSTNADPAVHIEMRQTSDETLLHFVNATGIDGNFSVTPVQFSVNLNIPTNRSVKAVKLTSPDLPNTGLTDLPYTKSNGAIHFQVPLTAYAMVVVSYQGAQSPLINDIPTVGDDNFYVQSGYSLSLSHADLLNNDGDLDNDTLTVINVTTNSNLVAEGNGHYRYTPPTGFIGTEKFSYTIQDQHGATDSGTISIHTVNVTNVYYPQTINVITGIYDWGTVNSLKASDDDYYEMKSASSGNGMATDWYATTHIGEAKDSIDWFKVSYSGQYSKNNISQKMYLYNYKNNQWELIDTSNISEGNDTTIAVFISENIGSYISANSEMRLRIHGNKTTNFWLWANTLKWEIAQKP